MASFDDLMNSMGDGEFDDGDLEIEIENVAVLLRSIYEQMVFVGFERGEALTIALTIFQMWASDE